MYVKRRWKSTKGFPECLRRSDDRSRSLQGRCFCLFWFSASCQSSRLVFVSRWMSLERIDGGTEVAFDYLRKWLPSSFSFFFFSFRSSPMVFFSIFCFFFVSFLLSECILVYAGRSKVYVKDATMGDSVENDRGAWGEVRRTWEVCGRAIVGENVAKLYFENTEGLSFYDY